MHATDWTCRKCGSNEQRPPRPRHNRPGTKTGCAECNRRSAQRQRQRALNQLLADPFHDITITPPISEYLAAFTTYLQATRNGDTRAAREAEAAKHAALTQLEDHKP